MEINLADGESFNIKGGEGLKVDGQDIIAQMMIETTWETLVIIRNNEGLVPGMQYRITDYVATTVQEHTQSANHPFDIIVTADSFDKLNEVARAIRHEGDDYFPETTKFEAWKIWYSLDNDTNRFKWADYANGKGVIYRMIDEFNNDVPYDFKGIMMRAYLGMDDEGNQLWSDDYRYTFGVDRDDTLVLSEEETSYNNKIGLCFEYLYDEEGDWSLLGIVQRINNITFGSDCHDNIFGLDCFSNTFGSDCHDNTFGSGCAYNTFGSGCAYNTFGSGCYDNIFGLGCFSNTFGSGCCDNTFGSGCFSNTFGSGCAYNTFGSGCFSNTFGSDCHIINLGDGSSYNTFGMGCGDITADFTMVFCEVKRGVYEVTLEPTEENGYEDYERLTIIEPMNKVVVQI